jgi:hypothetical protein
MTRPGKSYSPSFPVLPVGIGAAWTAEVRLWQRHGVRVAEVVEPGLT